MDGRQFRKIDWVTFSERIVAQSCDFKISVYSENITKPSDVLVVTLTCSQ